jgi:hypothetical protein
MADRLLAWMLDHPWLVYPALILLGVSGCYLTVARTLGCG